MDKFREIISKLTIDEKAQLITGASNMDTGEVERLGVHHATFADGPHGVRIEGDDSSNCVSMPCLAAAAATWNRDIVYNMGQGIARDCIKHNKNMILGPGVNIKRVDLCGRNFEYFSEDPVLSGEMGAAYVNGVQSLGVGACVKHFAVNNQEIDRLYVNAEIDERTMHEIYLKPFKIVIDKSNPASVMCAVNKVNSVLCSENKHLLTEILKNKWGYDGFVMSDWGCSKNAGRSIAAGLDLQMPKKLNIEQQVKDALDNGIITEEQLDNAVYNVLKYIMSSKPQKINYNRDEQHKTALETEQEAIVLLKNDDNLLPITKEKYKKIAVIGEYAEKPVIAGYGSSHVFCDEKYISSPLEYIKKLAGDDIEIVYESVYSTDKYFDDSHFNHLPKLYEAVDGADLVLMFIGRQQSVETEGTDRVTSHLDPYYEFFIKRIYPRNQKIVTVVQSGGAFMPLNWENKVKGIVQMWLGGEAAGEAIANILFGKINPSGKLSETFARKTRTDIDYPGDGFKVCYDEKWRVGYRYYDYHPDEVWYPFGHGLSYTQFEYSDMAIKDNGDKISVSLNVTNTGNCDGKEVVQLYVTDTKSTMSMPKKQLCGFEKVFIKANQTAQVIIEADRDCLSYYNTCLKKQVIEPGVFVFALGASAADIRLKQKYTVTDDCEYTISYNAEQIMG